MLYIHESMPSLELEHNDFKDSVWSISKLDTGSRLLMRSPQVQQVINKETTKISG